MHWLDDGSVTTPQGFSASGINTGVKTYGEEPRLDLGVPALRPPVRGRRRADEERRQRPGRFKGRAACSRPAGAARAICVNSGISNTVTGQQGIRDTERIGMLTAERFGD